MDGWTDGWMDGWMDGIQLNWGEVVEAIKSSLLI
jgi:hypothetical protein